VLTLAQRVTVVQAHQQALMPEEYLKGRTTDPATWNGSPPLPAQPKPDAASSRPGRPRPDPARPVDQRRQEQEQEHHQPGPGQRQGLQS
jgi:hypothetical protein